jgi:hypothetical protein
MKITRRTTDFADSWVHELVDHPPQADRSDGHFDPAATRRGWERRKGEAG